MIQKLRFTITIILILVASNAFSQFGRLRPLKLSTVEYENVIKLLSAMSKDPLRDTIFIKYDFNGDGCWVMLDGREDSYIMTVLGSNQKYIKELKTARPGISIIQVREPGTSFSKYKWWNKDIVVDEDRALFKLLGKKRTSCGTSFVILPGGTAYFVRSDSHFDIIRLYSKEKLNRKN